MLHRFQSAYSTAQEVYTPENQNPQPLHTFQSCLEAAGVLMHLLQKWLYRQRISHIWLELNIF